MIKHTQTIRRQIADELFECVLPFCVIGMLKNKHIHRHVPTQILQANILRPMIQKFGIDRFKENACFEHDSIFIPRQKSYNLQKFSNRSTSSKKILWNLVPKSQNTEISKTPIMKLNPWWHKVSANFKIIQEEGKAMEIWILSMYNI